MFLPEARGCGYAAEACVAALGWFACAIPDEPVVLCTQTANDCAMRLERQPTSSYAVRHAAVMTGCRM